MVVDFLKMWECPQMAVHHQTYFPLIEMRCGDIPVFLIRLAYSGEGTTDTTLLTFLQMMKVTVLANQ